MHDSALRLVTRVAPWCALAAAACSITPPASEDCDPLSLEAVADDASTPEDVPIDLILDGIHPHGEPLTVRVDSPPARGTLSVNMGPTPLSITFTPAPDWAGTDTFAFTVSAETGEVSNPKVVSIVVEPRNDPPVANDDVAPTTDSLTSVVIDVLANDTDVDDSVLTLVSVDPPPSGTIAFDAMTGAVTLTPAHPSAGAFDVMYTIEDAAGARATAVVSFTVTLANTQDTDGDGIPNHIEVLAGWDPFDPDTDDDTIWDGDEDANRDGVLQSGETDPADIDSDDDTLPDDLERSTQAPGVTLYPTSPTNPDSDGDGFCDGPRTDNDGDGIGPADPCTSQEILYVDLAAPPGGDGTTWASAFNHPQDAMDATGVPAFAGGDFDTVGQHIWVAAGMYRPQAANTPVLVMQQWVRVFGGWAGTERVHLERPLALGVTHFSGDFAVDDPVTSDNSNHVVQVATNAGLDGVVMSGGVGAPGGGGLFGLTGDLELRNALILGNQGGMGGGGLITGGFLRMEDVAVVRNTADTGGGIALAGTRISMNDVTFYGNDASNDGGGLLSSFSSSGGVFGANLHFENNTAADVGGGVQTAVTFGITNATFVNNSAGNRGGGFSGWPGRLTNVTFANNTATAGGAFTGSTGAQVHNALFWGNTGGSTRDVQGTPGVPEVQWSCMQQPPPGGMTGNILLDGTLSGGVTWADPFDIGLGGELLLAQAGVNGRTDDSACLNAGYDFSADDSMRGFVVMGVGDWRDLTTRRDDVPHVNTIDGTTPVSLGRYYSPTRVAIHTAGATSTDVAWVTRGADTCWLAHIPTATVSALPAADLAAGALPHGQSSGETLVLTCFGNDAPAVREVVVP